MTGTAIEEVSADKAYGRGPTYAFLRQQRIRASIPLHLEHLGEGQLCRRDFLYDRYPYEKLDRRLSKRYRILGGIVASVRSVCPACPRNIATVPALSIAVRIKRKSTGSRSDK